MSIFWWRKRAADRDLSAFLDGEVDDARAAEIGERLVFDPAYRHRRDQFDRVTALTDAATAPAEIPSSAQLAARVVDTVAGGTPPPTPPPAPTRRLSPALLASLGLLITAGVTFAGLRRRGLV